MDIGQKIKKRREELGMSQEQLAKKTGYKSRSSINKIEIDGRGLPQSKIYAFAQALETTPAYLMGWDEGPIADLSNGLIGLKAILKDIYGYAEDISVCGKYSECFYYKIGKDDNTFAITEADFDRLYESVKNTIQQFVSFIKCDADEEYQSCLESTNTPPDKELYERLRNNGVIYPELEEKYGYIKDRSITKLTKEDKSHLDPIAAHNDFADDPEQQSLMNEDIEDMKNNW